MALVGRHNVLLAMLLFAAVAPSFLNAYYVFVANTILIYVLLSIGLNILVGYAGQLAFANAAMFGIGAYGTGLLQVQLGWPFWLAFPSGAIIATAVGLALSLPALRLSGLHLTCLRFCAGADDICDQCGIDTQQDGHDDQRCKNQPPRIGQISRRSATPPSGIGIPNNNLLKSDSKC